MTIKELNKKRTALFEQISKMRDAFNKNGQKWSDPAEEAKWDAAIKDYDATADACAVNQRADDLDREMKSPINPKNIGLDDAGNGRVGARRSPGSNNSGRIRQTNREYVVDQNGKRQPLLRNTESYARALTRTNPDLAEQNRGVSVGGYLRAMALGARTPGERNALYESGGSSGGFTVPTRLAAELIDLLRAKSRCIQAGAKTVKLDAAETTFAMLTGDPTPQWLAERAESTETEPTFGAMTFRPCTLRMLVKCSRELLEDSINLSQKLPQVFATSMSAELDRVALVGLGTGNGDGPEPLGVLNYSGINTTEMHADGATPDDFAKILDAVEQIETANAESPTTAIMHPRTKRTYAGLVDTTGQPLMRPKELENLQFLTTTKLSTTEVQGSSGAICSSIVLGGFEQMIIGMRSQIKIDLLTERYAETFEYGFLISLRADCGSFYEQAFAKIIGIKA